MKKCPRKNKFIFSWTNAGQKRNVNFNKTLYNNKLGNSTNYYIVKEGSQHDQDCTTFIVIRGHKIQTYLREATKQGVAILKFECDEYERHYGSSYDRCAAQDTKYTKLEDKIEHIINVLEEIADNRDERDRQRKLEEERKRQEEERKRQEEKEQNVYKH